MSDTSSTQSVERIFTSQYVYPEWFTEKKYYFYRKMLERLKKLRYVHSRAGEYYSKLSMYIFGPSISITALSGIGSFLSTSEFIDQSAQTSFGITVGVMASISTMLQSIASVCQYSAKTEAHRTAADEYNKLIVRLKFEMEMPDEPEFTTDLETQILDIQNKCKYIPPQFILNEWTKKKKNDTVNDLKFKEQVKSIKRNSLKKYGTFSSENQSETDSLIKSKSSNLNNTGENQVAQPSGIAITIEESSINSLEEDNTVVNIDSSKQTNV